VVDVIKKKEELTFYQVVRAAAVELVSQRSVVHVLRVNAYYQERNALATFCHRRTKRKRLFNRSIDMKAMTRCTWTSSLRCGITARHSAAAGKCRAKMKNFLAIRLSKNFSFCHVTCSPSIKHKYRKLASHHPFHCYHFEWKQWKKEGAQLRTKR
jgi:hypothetical protein